MEIAGVQYSLLGKIEAVRQCEDWLKDKRQRHIVTLNPEMVVEAQHNQSFAEAMERADVRVADGSGLLWAAEYLTGPDRQPWLSLLRLLRQKEQQPVTGVMLLGEMARLCREQDRGLFLLGASEVSNGRACKALRTAYPGLRVEGISGGVIDMTGSRETLKTIQTANPAVLMVAYGVPYQTLWIDRHLSALPRVQIAMGVGGAFDMWAEVTPRAPRWWQERHLEWLWRWGLQPGRWRRIWRAIFEFGRLVQTEKKRRFLQNQH